MNKLLGFIDEIKKSFEAVQKELMKCKENLAALKSAKEEILKRLEGESDIDLERESEVQNVLAAKINTFSRSEIQNPWKTLKQKQKI